MNAKELRGKTPADLKEELMKLRREQFNLRVGRATGQPPKPDQWGKVRRNIARLKTVLSQRQGAATEPSAATGKAAAKRPSAAARGKE